MRGVAFFGVGAACACALSVVTAQPAPAPAAAPVDFVRDVQPIFEKYCVDCHGPEKQMNGFRLDRRADAKRGGTGVMIGGSALSTGCTCG